MNILIFGGTKFVGRHITDAALMHGHAVTLFNRGMTNADLFAGVEKIHANREGGLAALHGRRWDAVIDVNGYLPRLVGAAARALADCVPHYIYISTISVYADFQPRNQDELAPVAQLADPTTETIDNETYGGLKAQCEAEVTATFPDRATLLRLGYVVGPHDSTDRWTSWMRRLERGGKMLAPGDGTTPVQLIDARDVAAFTLRTAETPLMGTFNVTGPAAPLTWAAMLETARQVTHANTELIWVDDAFLTEHDVMEHLPMYPPPEIHGIMTANISKARRAGLEYTPLTETVRDTLAWDAEHGTPRLGLTPEREQELLQQWEQEKNANATL